jgi:hypothetical protein
MIIGSIIEKIRGIEFVAPKGSKPMKALRVVKMGTGYSDNIIMVELANGQFIAARAIWNSRGYYLGFSEERVFDGLVALGRITKEEKKAHLDFENHKRAEKQKTWDRESLEELAKTYGFEITEEQRRKLNPKEKP